MSRFGSLAGQGVMNNAQGNGPTEDVVDDDGVIHIESGSERDPFPVSAHDLDGDNVSIGGPVMFAFEAWLGSHVVFHFIATAWSETDLRESFRRMGYRPLSSELTVLRRRKLARYGVKKALDGDGWDVFDRKFGRAVAFRLKKRTEAAAMALRLAAG